MNTNVIEEKVEQVGQAASKAHPWLEPMVRLGYVAKGLIYGLVGLLAVNAAFGWAYGAAIDRRGAIDYIAHFAIGPILLYLLGAGLLAYATWRVLMAFYNPEDKSMIKRIGYFVTAMAYGGVGVYAFLAAQGISRRRADESERVSTVLMWPLGQAIVASIGLVLGGLAIAQLVNAYKGLFRGILNTDRMSKMEERVVLFVGRIGLAARGLVFGLISWFFLNAAWEHSGRQAGGIEEALRLLANSPQGPVLLGVAGFGLIFYGLFMFLEAHYRCIVPPKD